ncbi:MAG: TolC family protein, partial [Helicobacteraceae bacterium]|nr:TolC family protein [Candidatus Sulfurimonas ponti]
MELKIFFALSITLSLQAYDLREIVNSLHTSEKAKEIKEKSYADIASAALNTAYESPEFGVGLTEVRLDDGSDKGLEYSMGVSQNIAQPFSHKSKKRAALAMTNSIKQEAKHTFHIFVLDTVSLYHDVCIAKELKEEAKVLYEDQVKMFGQVQSSYDLGEVSKKSLLLNKLELMKLEQKTSAYKRAYEIDLHSLQSQVDSLEIKEVS